MLSEQESKTEFKETISLDRIDISVTEDNYYYIHIHKGTEVSLDLVKRVINTMATLQSTKKLPVLIKSDSFSLPTKETREFLAQKNASPYAKAEAYVIFSMAQKIVGNFYLNFNKPQRPTKLFNDLKSARAWLKQFED